MILMPLVNPSPWGGAGVGYSAPQTTEQTFAYTATKPLKSVALVGTFNGWSKDANPMKVGDDGRTWTTTVRLPLGRTQYKFVLDGDAYVVDPKGKTVDDGNGHQNSELVVVPADFSDPRRPARRRRRHQRPEPHVPDLPDANVDRGRLILKLHGQAPRATSPPSSFAPPSAPPSAWPASRATTSPTSTRPPSPREKTTYTFALADGRTWRTFGADGLDRTMKPFTYDLATARRFVVPSWPEGTVVYQIFPDRFANGEQGQRPPRYPSRGVPTSSPTLREWAATWLVSASTSRTWRRSASAPPTSPPSSTPPATTATTPAPSPRSRPTSAPTPTSASSPANSAPAASAR